MCEPQLVKVASLEKIVYAVLAAPSTMFSGTDHSALADSFCQSYLSSLVISSTSILSLKCIKQKDTFFH